MCEPTNSITQYPDQDDEGRPTQGPIEADLRRQDREQGKKSSGFWDWLKRIGGFLHLTKLGSGHSEAIRRLGAMSHMLIPEETRYECFWWNRTVKCDGYFHGKEEDRGLALKACTKYAHAVSIGNLGVLRRFLEVSLRKTEIPYLYIEAFRQLLNREGKLLFERKLMLSKIASDYGQMQHDAVETAIKVMLGFTRKRALLCPEWADDAALWLPAKGMGGLLPS